MTIMCFLSQDDVFQGHIPLSLLLFSIKATGNNLVHVLCCLNSNFKPILTHLEDTIPSVHPIWFLQLLKSGWKKMQKQQERVATAA